MTKAVSVPTPLLEELYHHFNKIEEILATLEELADKEGQKRIEKSLEGSCHSSQIFPINYLKTGSFIF